MRVNYFKGILVLSIIVLGVMLGPSCNADFLTSGVDNEFNTKFINYIENLPSDAKDPLVNILEYIKKHAGCNDYEAAKINSLMAIKSEQTLGFDYYLRYMMGNTTAEEDNADYYRAIREEWDQFLNEYAKMTPEQRAEALMTSATNDDVKRILGNANSEELEYIQNKIEPYKNKLEDKSKDLLSKSTWWMIEHPNDLNNIATDINYIIQQYNEEIVIADGEWNIIHNTERTGKLNFNPIHSFSQDIEYDKDAYPNAIAVRNELLKIGEECSISNTFNENDRDRPLFCEGDLVQYRINSSNVNKPMYKYFLLKTNNSDRFYGIDMVDMFPQDVDGNEITEEGKDIAGIHIFQSPRRTISSSVITPDSSKYTIHLNQTSEWGVSELYTAYDKHIDPTGLIERLGDIPKFNGISQSEAIAKMAIGSAAITGGVIAIIIAIIGIKGACAAIPATAGISAIGLAPSIALLFSGLSAIITGSVTISDGVKAYKEYNSSKKLHDEGERDIFNDIQKHNRYPEAAAT